MPDLTSLLDPPQVIFYKKGGRLSALFHPNLCGRNAAEWLIAMKRVWKVLAIILAVVLLLVCIGGVFIYRMLYPTAITAGEGANHVICIGDSITFGQGTMTTRDVDGFPAQLAVLLGEDYRVTNYGLPNRTLQSTGNMPYTQEDFYAESLAQNPDIVIIMLGSNDSKPDFWNPERFKQEYSAFIRQYQNMESQPAVYVMIPPAIFLENPDSGDCNDEIVKGELAPIVTEIARELGVTVIDLNTLTQDHPEWFADGLHPNKEGNEAIAKAIFTVISTR